MRKPRLIAKPGEDGIYHCTSRIVGGAHLIGETEKRWFVSRMRKLAHFLGIKILTYTVMDNHYHQLVSVPCKRKLSDNELLGRVEAFYGRGSVEAKKLSKALQTGGTISTSSKKSYMQRIGNISEFQKLLKQEFTRWYNKRHNRKGTLWMERFKSVLVENSRSVIKTVACYIDLNPVRACVVHNPADYSFSGFATALWGDLNSRKGILEICGCFSWTEAENVYGNELLNRGKRPARGKRGVIPKEATMKTPESSGNVGPQGEIHNLSNLVIGSADFIKETAKRIAMRTKNQGS